MKNAGRTFSCFLIGENSMVASCGEMLLERGHRVLGVVSPDGGVRDWAERGGLPAADFGPDVVAYLGGRGSFDYLFSIANLRMLPAEVLALPRQLPVNFHDGPLPGRAGLYATTWALLDGDTSHAVTWHVMTQQADAGDVLLRRPVPIDPDDTSHTLNVKCFEAGIESFGELIDALAAGRAERHPQDLSRYACHGRFDRPAGGGLLSWDNPADQLSAAVRAAEFGPHPNTFGTAKALLHGGPVLVRGLEVLAERSGRPPGTVLAWDASGVRVATGDHDVRLTGVSTPMGDPLTVADLTGRGCLPGRRLPVADAALSDAVTRVEAAALRAEAFWTRRLADLDPAEPPWSGARPHGPSNGPSGACAAYRIPVPAHADRAAAAAGLELPQWLLTAFLAFLARTGVRAGTDVHLRLSDQAGRHEIDDALYAAFVPLRVPALDGCTMAALGAEVSTRLAEVTRHGTHAYDLWARYPQLHERRPAAPGVPIAIEFVPDIAEPATLPEGTTLLIRIPRGGGPCQWLVADCGPDNRAAGWTAGYAATFLQAAAADEGRAVTRIPLGDDEARRIVAAANDTAADFPLDMCVHEMISRQARSRPDAPAVVFAGRTISYGELDHTSSLLAGWLRGRGVGPGRMVGTYLRRSADLVVTLLAAMKSGAAYVPLDPLYPADRIEHILTDTALDLLVTESSLAGTLPRGDTEVLALDTAWPQIRAAGPLPETPIDAATDAYVLYTSGSTGRSKGVRVSHRALTNFVCAMAHRPGFTPDDRMLAVTTICFDIAGLELFVPLATGGQVELAPAETAADGFLLRELLETSRPTVMQATPATWRMLIDAGWQGRPGDAGLRMLCGGEQLLPDLAEALLARGRLWNMYGPTETTIWSGVAEVTDAQRITIGLPIPNTRFHVLDAWQQPLPPGLPGELYIGGTGVASGYWRRPELTAQRFVPDTLGPGGGKLYRTGDVVRQLPDGELEYLGRADGQVKLHGYRIEPGEIEAALRAHPSVAEAVVAVREDLPGQRRLVGYIVPRDVPVGAGVLRTHLSGLLPGYMVPATFVPLDRLPLTANGKTDRRALPRPMGPSPAAPHEAGEGMEGVVAAIWREVLHLERVGVEDNFFEVGGDSLRLMRVMARLKDVCPKPLTRVEMFRYPTVRSLAAHLAPSGGGTASVPPPRRPGPGRAALRELRDHRRERTVQPPTYGPGPG